MKYSIWLASLFGCLVMIGCGDPADSAAVAEADAGVEASFDFVKDADFETAIKSGVVVANFTADW